MAIYYTRGDLLQSNAEAIVNTVNCVGIMGKGIALQFKQQYRDNYLAYQKACYNGEVKIGKMFITSINSRIIINFPTKDHWRHPSKLEYIEKGLIDLVAQIRRLGIRSIAIPALGCANGGLEWYKVKPMIEEAFLLIRDVDVYLYEPQVLTPLESPEKGQEHSMIDDVKVTEDAFGHINIWSKGKTELGRLLSNFTYSPTKHPLYGTFNSIESFWYWLSTGKTSEELRKLNGYAAKQFGSKLKVIKIDNFYEEVRSMLELKVEQNKHLKMLLIQSELPFEHYYTYGNNNNCTIILPNSREWLIEQWEEIRQRVKQEGFRLIIAGSRDLASYSMVKEAFYNSNFSTMPLEIVSGGARGIDSCGERLSKEELHKEPKIFKADWDGPYKKAAGFIRNHQMGDYADGLMAFTTGTSGTQDMIDYATKKGLVVEIINLSPKETPC